jgi:hypothetical protein
MCNIKKQEIRPGEWEITCELSGKRITISNENGMYCDDMCDEDKDIAAGKFFENFISFFNKIDDSMKLK